MAFTREEMAAYEKQPQKVADPAPHALADPAPKNLDAIPAGDTQEVDTADAAVAADPSGDVETDPAEPGDGTSDENADPSTATADPSGEIEPPKKGSAGERIQELNDLMHGYKEFGREKSEEVKALRAEIARLTALSTGKTTATTKTDETPAVDADEPMPDLADPDVNYDADKLRAKTQKWVKKQIAQGARAVVQEATGKNQVETLRSTFEARANTFAETHKDWKKVVSNPEFIAHQLAPAASLAVAKSDLGPDLVYRMGTDLELAARIAKMPVADQLEAIGELKAEIKAKKAAAASTNTSDPANKSTNTVPGAKPANKKSVTQAPNPPTATRAAGRAQQREETDPSMDMDEFARQHRDKRQLARKQNRSARGLG